MLRSMTGFGAGTATVEGEELSIEVRSVNQKYIDIKARLPRELAGLEPELLGQVKAKLVRGTVDLQVHRRSLAGSVLVSVDLELAREYARAFGQLASSLGSSEGLSLNTLFEREGVVRLEERPASLSAAREALQRATGLALEQLLGMREREGEALWRDLDRRLETLGQLLTSVRHEAPAALAEHRRRLLGRIAELVQGEIEPGRLEQEVALLGERTDVAEELTRLESHLRQFRELLAGAGPAGRRLDFLAQELHREVTTLGNKSQSAVIARLVIELKAEVERVREQVQNIE